MVLTPAPPRRPRPARPLPGPDPDTGLDPVLNGSKDGFSDPTAVAADGTHVWVANSGDDSVIELDAATGAPVVNGSAYGFSGPSAVAAGGARVWVTNYGGDSVTEFPESPQ